MTEKVPAPSLFDVVLPIHPLAAKEGKEAQTRFAYKTGATQVLFIQPLIDSLKNGGTCSILLDEGVLYDPYPEVFGIQWC